MKKCTYCGQEYPDGATVCELDANPLVAMKGKNPVQPPAVEMTRLDKLFANSSGIFFWGADVRLLWGVIGVLACKHPTARKNAWIYFGGQIGILVLVFIIFVLVKKTKGR
jgi:hypothetical protein